MVFILQKHIGEKIGKIKRVKLQQLISEKKKYKKCHSRTETGG
jgi:hypothetical protein